MSLLRFFPTGLLTKLAVYGLVFTIGLSVGNSWATKAALERELQASANRQRENHEQLITWYAEKMKEIRVSREKQADADLSAYSVMEKGKVDAERGKRLAERKLAAIMAAIAARPKPKEPTDVAPIVPVSPDCVLPDGVRLALNGYIASINSNAGLAATDPASGPDGAAAANPPLTCEELAGSVTDILEHDANMIAQVLSWQQWAREVLK